MNLMEIRMSMDAREINELMQDQLEQIRRLRLKTKAQDQIIGELHTQEDELRNEIARLNGEVAEYKATIQDHLERATES